MHSKRIRKIGWILPLLIVQIGWGQVITGTVLGTVTDPTGAVISGATVTVRNVGTGITRTATTDAGGRYRLPELALGNYEVTTNATGFQSMVRSGITLTVGQVATVDFSLQIGSVNESVTVTGEAPLVNATNATVSGLVSEQAMKALPLNGRSFGDLAATQPGVITNLPLLGAGSPNGSYSSMYTGGGGAARRIISGAKPQQSTYLLDGIELTTPSRGMPVDSVVGSELGVDAVREFSVIQNSAGAQFGRAAGGVVNAVTQSGTNNLHGSLFEFLRNQALDARDWFLPSVFGQTPYKRNQFGATLGGRIKKDRTFFFSNFEAIREAAAIAYTGSTLTDQVRVGGITNSAGAVTSIVTVNPDVVPIMNLLPHPTVLSSGISYLNGGVARYYAQPHYSVGENFGLARIDHQISDKDSLFGRITIDRSYRTDQMLVITPAPPFAYQQGGYVLGALSWTRVLSSTIVNTARIGYTRRNDAMWQTYTHLGDQFPNAPGIDPRLQAAPGIPLGSFSVTGVVIYPAIGPGLTSSNTFVDNTFDESDSLIINHSRHSITVGGGIKRYQTNTINDTWVYGNPMSFTSMTSFLAGTPSADTQELGFLRPGNAFPDTYRGWRQTYGGVFAQDNFQVRPNLTLNLGARWEILSSPREVNGKLAQLANFNTDSTLTRLSGSSAPYFALRAPLKGLSPRFGFAWSPLGSSKTVLRGGWGMYIEMPLPYMWATAIDVPVLAERYTVNAPSLKYPFAFSNPAALQNTQEPLVVPHSFKEPYTMQWNMSLERQFGDHWVVRLQYLGLRALDQVGIYNPDQPFVTTLNGRPYTPSAARPNPKLTGIRYYAPWGDQLYNAGQLVVEKRFSGGLRFNSSYTWARNIDNSPAGSRGAEVLQTPVILSPYNAYDFGMDKGLSPYNVSHNWITSLTYELPFGTGHTFGGQSTGVTGKVLGGWSLNVTHTAHTGLPLDLNDSLKPSPSGCIAQTCSERPDLIPGGNNNPVVSNWDPNKPYFDVHQFAVPAFGYFGNLGRDTLIGPGLWEMDLGLSKLTRITEGKNLEIRVEIFNILNHPNFGAPNVDTFSAANTVNPSSGLITSTNTSMRQIQFAMKFTF